MYKDNAVCVMVQCIARMSVGSYQELMEKMYNERVIFKKKMIEAKKAYEKTPTKRTGRDLSL